MTSHPNRSRGPYTAAIGGSSWSHGPTAEFSTIREARAWAEEYGNTADYCTITDKKGRVVASHRQVNGHWYRVAP